MIRVAINPDTRIKLKKIVLSSMIVFILISFVSGFFYLNFQCNHINEAIKRINSNLSSLKKKDLTIYTDREIQTYKQMVENLKDSNEKILETVYWSLGGILGIIIVILGSNIFYNFRINKNEMENIKNALSLSLEETKNKNLEIIQKNAQDQIKNISENFHYNVNNFDKKLKQTEEKLIDMISNLKSEFFEKESSITNKFALLHSEIVGHTADLWGLKDVPVNALKYETEKAILDIELKQPIESSLSNIYEYLDKITSISTFSQSDVIKLIEKLPDKYSVHKDKLQNIIKSKSIR